MGALMCLWSIVYCSDEDDIEPLINEFTVDYNYLTDEQLNVDDTSGIEGEECPICLESYVKDELVNKLKCGHCFHLNCWESWRNFKKYDVSCPMCRFSSRENMENIIKSI